MKSFSKQFVVLLLNLTTMACAQPQASTKQADSKPEPAAYVIKIDNFSFSPATLTVPAGAKVIWTNHDDMPHNVVSSEQKFKSKLLDTDDSYSNAFTEPGTYQYFCGLHPKMVGKIVVEPAKAGEKK
jgi:amicyanin